jgi:hypothetical protein
VRDYHEVLRRIAAMLLALAALAERAGDRSRPVRALVLWALRQAEAVASTFVAETDPLVPIAYSMPGSGHDEAARLAEAFRMLAAALFVVAHEAQRLALREPSGQPASGYLPGSANAERLLGAIAALQPRYADTS